MAIHAYLSMLSYTLPIPNIRKAALSIIKKVRDWHLSEGNQGLKRAKALYVAGVWIAIGSYSSARFKSYLSDKGLGCALHYSELAKMYTPRLLKGLLPYLLSDSIREKRVALTVLTAYRLWDSKILPGEVGKFKDELTRECKDIPSSTVKSFKVAMGHFLDLFPTKIRAVYPSFSDRKGPFRGSNAQRIPDAAQTILGCGTEENYVALYDFYEQLCGYKPDIDLREFQPAHGSELRRLSKLSIIPDKGGKCRHIAMVDYFSQQVLFVLHTYLMEKFKKIPSDFSSDHNKGFLRALIWTNPKTRLRPAQPDLALKTYSSDLSQFSTLVPRKLIKITLECIYDHILKVHNILPSKAVISRDVFRDVIVRLLCERPFTPPFQAKGEKEWYYREGSPMGVYGSWPISVLIHHVLILLAAFPKGKYNYEVVCSHLKTYVLIGDDFCTYSRVLFSRYIGVVVSLGMSISRGKVESDEWDRSGTSVFTASRIGVLGKNITPGSLVDLYRVWKSNYDISSLIHKASAKFFIRLFSYFSSCRFHPKATTYRKVLLALPKVLGGKGVVTIASSFSAIEDVKIKKLIRTPYFMKNLLKTHLDKVFKNISIALELRDEHGKTIPLEDQLTSKGVYDLMQNVLNIDTDQEDFSTLLTVAEGLDLLTDGPTDFSESLLPDDHGLSAERAKALNKFVNFRCGGEILDILSSRAKDLLGESLSSLKFLDVIEGPEEIEGIMEGCQAPLEVRVRQDVFVSDTNLEQLRVVLDQVRKVQYFQNKRETFSRTLYDSIKKVFSRIYLNKPYKDMPPGDPLRTYEYECVLELISDLYEKVTPRNSLMYNYV